MGDSDDVEVESLWCRALTHHLSAVVGCRLNYEGLYGGTLLVWAPIRCTSVSRVCTVSIPSALHVALS
jgi:hypothetical protein